MIATVGLHCMRMGSREEMARLLVMRERTSERKNEKEGENEGGRASERDNACV